LSHGLLGLTAGQRTASFDLKRGNSRQFAGGSGDARSIVDRKLLLRRRGLLLRRRGDGDASEHEKCRPLLRSEGQVAFVHKDDLAPRINREGIENLLILFATRAADR